VIPPSAIKQGKGKVVKSTIRTAESDDDETKVKATEED
jgi:hypothetical protein